MQNRALTLAVAIGIASLSSVDAHASPTTYVEAAATVVAPAPAVNAPPRAPRSVLGGLTVYTDRALFNADFPGLSIEDFEGGSAAPGNFSVCDAPLDAAGDAACGFDPGEILDGVAFQDNPGPDLASLILLGNGTSLNATQALVSNTFDDSFDILFNPPVTQAGMDLHSTPAPGQGPPDIVLVEAFDAGDVLIGSDPAAAASGPGDFWGMSSPVAISRIRITSSNARAEGVDNLAFVGAPLVPKVPVPASNLQGIFALLALVGAAGFLALRRR